MYRNGFLILITVIFIYACKDKKNTESINIDTAVDITSSSKIDSIQILEKDFDLFYTSSTLSDSSFIGLFSSTDTIGKLWYKKHKIADTRVNPTIWNVIDSLEWGYVYPDTTLTEEIMIDNIPYILFSCSEGYQGASIIEHNVCFYAIDMHNLNYYTLSSTGKYSFKCDDCIDGEFYSDEKLNKKPLVKQKLLDFAKKSKLIYQRTDRDDDIYYYMNFEEKWNKDNNADYAYGTGYSTINDTIISTYYTTNLFKLVGGESPDPDNFIENENYKIATYFRNDVIGYNKNKNLYFPIFVESCSLGCNKDIEFDEEQDDLLVIRYNESGDTEYKVYLDKIIFDPKIGD